jgi:phage terminase large subunit
MAEILLSEVVGKNYDSFWASKHFYRVLKGSRGSKKSKTTALWYIYHLMKYPQANLLVVRKVYETLRTSCFQELLWAIDRLGVSELWTFTYSPLSITYTPTGQRIIFKGLDKGIKVTSVAVSKGYLCWVWIEEAYEITNEEDYDMLDMSIRGSLPSTDGLFKQFTFTFNPWSADTWLKSRFFDNPAPNVWTGTTTFRDNDFLDDADIQRYLDWYKRDPRGARVVCDGEWGIAEGLVYNNWEELPIGFDINAILKRDNIKCTYGLDFGYSISYNAFVAVAVDMNTREMWVFDEMYSRGMTNVDIGRTICQMGYGKVEIWADRAEMKSINELQNGLIEEVPQDNGTIIHKKWQLPNIHPAMKGNDSVANGIQRLQSFKIWVMPKCRNMITELNNYAWAVDKDGKHTGKPIKEWDHLCLTGDTEIISVDGPKRISEICEGDMVLSHLGWQPVSASAMTDDDAEIWELVLENDVRLEGTWNHPVITLRGEVPLGELTSQDHVMTWDWTEGYGIKRVHHATVTSRRAPVYSITVEDSHDFFANGILVRNCDALRYAMEKFFIRGKGHVAEAKGIDILNYGTPTKNNGANGAKYKSRRVASSIKQR